MKPSLDWYFDFISPFSYLQETRLARLGELASVSRRPVLFAALLKHWGNIGPAELPTKRVWTFEHCAWLAYRDGIPMTIPSQHPFNPLPLLRLALAYGENGVVPADVVSRLFRFVWVEGQLPSAGAPWQALLDELGEPLHAADSPDVKQALRDNGDRALGAGVFGVPTSVVKGQAFWGFEASDMLESFLRGDAFFASAEFKAPRAMPEGLQRDRSRT